MKKITYLSLCIAFSPKLYASNPDSHPHSDSAIHPPVREHSVVKTHDVEYFIRHGYTLCLRVAGRKSLGMYLLKKAELHPDATVDQRLEVARLLAYIRLK